MSSSKAEKSFVGATNTGVGAGAGAGTGVSLNRDGAAGALEKDAKTSALPLCEGCCSVPKAWKEPLEGRVSKAAKLAGLAEEAKASCEWGTLKGSKPAGAGALFDGAISSKSKPEEALGVLELIEGCRWETGLLAALLPSCMLKVPEESFFVGAAEDVSAEAQRRFTYFMRRNSRSRATSLKTNVVSMSSNSYHNCHACERLTFRWAAGHRRCSDQGSARYI